MNDIKTIRTALCANRGGLADATDTALRRLWNTLGTDVQNQYLETIQERPDHADSHGPQSAAPRGAKK